jgi:hypothetical protein
LSNALAVAWVCLVLIPVGAMVAMLTVERARPPALNNITEAKTSPATLAGHGGAIRLSTITEIPHGYAQIRRP